MRFVIYGIGAVGGTLAVRLAHAGYEVAGIARGEQLEKISQNGLTLRTPDGDVTAQFACAPSPKALGLRKDDAVFLCMKSQNTESALEDLRAAGAVSQSIFCVQNGVENERMASRYFANVYGVAVMMPCDYATPGEVLAFGTPKAGLFDVGRFPAGQDETLSQVGAALEAANFAVFAQDDIMASKYGKLLLNLGNVLDASFPDKHAYKPWQDKALAEAKSIYEAAGIKWREVGFDDPRRTEFLNYGEIPGAKRLGSSSRQSLLRNAGSIETDFLNGEIALIARLNDMDAPINAALCRIAAKLVSGDIKMGTVTDLMLEEEIARG